MSDVAVNPRRMPLGAVLTHPQGRGQVVRMAVGDDTGRGQHCWQSLPGYELPAGRRLHHVEVVGWLRTQTPQVDVQRFKEQMARSSLGTDEALAAHRLGRQALGLQ